MLANLKILTAKVLEKSVTELILDRKKNEKKTKGNDKQEEADAPLHDITSRIQR